MRNRFLSDWRHYVLFAVVASFALTPVFADAKDRVQTTTGSAEPTRGVQLTSPGGDDDLNRPTDVTRYARSNYVWQYATGPVYGTVTGRATNAPGVLNTRVGALRLADFQSQLPAELQTIDRLDTIGAQYFILQIDPASIPNSGVDALKEQILASGGQVVGSMPVNFLVARLTAGSIDTVRSLNGIQAVVPYQAAFKLDPMIGRRPLIDPVKAVSEVIDVDVALFEGEHAAEVAPQILALGARVNGHSDRLLAVSINRATLGRLAGIQAIEDIREAHPLLPEGFETTMTMQVGGVGNVGFGRLSRPPYHLAGLDGSGNGVIGTCDNGVTACTAHTDCVAGEFCSTAPQTLLVIDNGAQVDAADLSNDDLDAGTPGPGHRKVVSYRSATDFGGDGDDQGCDDPDIGAGTHGHVVSATALGNATYIINTSTGWDPLVQYFLEEDVTNDPWAVDGVAPGATLALLDANATPAAGTCQNPQLGTLSTGPNYYTNTAPPLGTCPGAGCPGFLQTSYRDFNAKISNMSFGTVNEYSFRTRQIDQFIFDKEDALVFTSAGNSGFDVAPNDGFDDLGSITDPATSKNGVTVGGSSTGSAGNAAEIRYTQSSLGPALLAGTAWEDDPIGSPQRVQPIVMAPGVDLGTLGIVGEYVCLSDDNDITGAVQCDRNAPNTGTSFASPAAAGAALLIRDYLAQGYYPSGAQNNGNREPVVSGAAVKAMLIASADFLNGGGSTPRPNRFNNEQGYGRIQLDNVLPLQTWPNSVNGLIIADGGIASGPNNLSGINGVIDGTNPAAVDSATFTVCNADEELRVALAWTDAPISGDNGWVNTDLDLELCAPSGGGPCTGKVYHGNYFTDDDDRDKVIDTFAEDCPDEEGVAGSLSTGQWSLPRCTRPDGTPSPRDHANNTEGIFLTPDLDGDNNLAVNPDPDPSDDTQIVPGEWTVRVKVDNDPGFGPGLNAQASQTYALVISGGACIGSSVRFDSGTYTCNVESTITVNEIATVNETLVSDRTTVEVFESDGTTLLDTETGLNFTQDPGAQRYKADPILLSDGTAPEAGNGVLDISDGDVMRVTYADPAGDRISEAAVSCKMRISAGAVTFGQFGFDRPVAIQGGCERNARGLFEFGFPDRYLDEDEEIIFSFAFASQESGTIEELEASLRCVIADDAQAPEDCRAGSQPTATCPNPDRILVADGGTHNACNASWLEITNSPIVIDSLPANTAIGLNYGLQMGAAIPDLQEVEFVLELSATTAGLSGVSRAVVRQRLDADEIATLYSTDFPTGGLVISDINNNEYLQGCEGANPLFPCGGEDDPNPTRRQDDFTRDYRFETRSYSDLTAAGTNTVNTNLAAFLPWNFDQNPGGLRNGVAAPTDFAAITDLIAQWGEDTNFNNLLDGFCSARSCSITRNLSCSNNGNCPALETCDAAQPLGRCGGNPAGELCAEFDDPGDPDLTPEDCETSGFGLNCVLTTCATGGDCFGVFPSNPPPNNFLARCISEIEDFDPASNGMLENVWNTSGGCGWQTAVAGVCTGGGAEACYLNADCPAVQTCTQTAPLRGMWHTGRIGPLTDINCLGVGADVNQCQGIETVSGETGERLWFELLVTPEINKVSSNPDDEVNIEIFSWNQALDLEDSNAGVTWEIDGDLDSIVPVDLTSDGTLMGIAFGGFTPRGGTDGTAQNNPDLTNGYSMFAPTVGLAYDSTNGSVGANRVGRNACYFSEGTGLTTASVQELGLAGPLDDDLNNGYCPGDFKFPCTAVCAGGSTSVADGTPCNMADTGQADICGSPGSCISTDATFNSCDTTVICNGSNQCETTDGFLTGASCTTPGSDPACYTCQFENVMIDEYVFANGPIRNMDPTAVNGPDLRFTTVEDVQGESKERFKAAIGILNFEKADADVPDPVASYGIGVDDFLFEWRELSLVADASDCTNVTTGGACASMDTSIGTAFNGSTALDVTVLDSTRGTGSDCNFDGDNTDVGIDDFDCDNDGVWDVPIIAKSENEQPGEQYFLPCRNPTAGPSCDDGEYTGSVPVSATYDSDGVVFVQAQGVQNPVIEINYFDWDDGTGNTCANNIDPLFNGLIQSFTAVSLTSGNVAVTQILLVDNGDTDAWADTNETIDARITVRNNTSVILNNVVARLATVDPKIDCIIEPEIAIGTLEPDNQSTIGVDEGSTTSTSAFTFRIANVQRTGFCTVGTTVPCQDDVPCVLGGGDKCDAHLRDFSADLVVYLEADEFDTSQLVQNVTIDLDIDGSGGGIPDEIVENFDSGVNGGFGIFGINNMDSFNVVTAGQDPPQIAGTGGNGGSLPNADGFRCSYADPADANSFTFGDPDCYMGIDQTHADSVWWKITTDRAYDGTQSASYNTPAGGILGWTTPTGVLEGIQMRAPVALGYRNVCADDANVFCDIADVPDDCASATPDSEVCIPAFPRAVWKHQISLMDFRTVNASSAIRSADGGVVHLQLSDENNNPVGSWIKVDTVANQYDSQREDNYNICSFDPIDDGHDEDDFDFRDGAGRKIGPSSTCFPEFSYTYMGDTDSAFDPNNIGNATQGPGLEGSDTHAAGAGLGTWVESVVDLSRFRGQNARVRMMVSSLKIDTTWQAAFNFTISRPGDDGWWVDDFRIKDAITSPALLVADVKANTNQCSVGLNACDKNADCTAGGGDTCEFPLCGNECNTVTASLVADPAGTLAAPGQVTELSALGSSADRCLNGTLQYRFWTDDLTNGVYDAGSDTLLRNWSENGTLLAAPFESTVYGTDIRCSSLLTCTAATTLPVAVNCPAGTINLMADGAIKGRFTFDGPIPFRAAEGLAIGPTYSTAGPNTSGNGSFYDLQYNPTGWVLVRKDLPGTGCNAPGVWYGDGSPTATKALRDAAASLD